jgi:hypothetical protein
MVEKYHAKLAALMVRRVSYLRYIGLIQAIAEFFVFVFVGGASLQGLASCGLRPRWFNSISVHMYDTLIYGFSPCLLRLYECLGADVAGSWPKTYRVFEVLSKTNVLPKTMGPA